jgi:hypothetical protein
MLGEKIGEASGRTTSTRVIPSEDGSPTFEVSMLGSGKLIGVEGVDNGTYVATLLPTGFFRGEGQGVFMGKDGEVATWKGYGRGRPTGPGSASWRGCVFYSSASAKLARLNGVCVAFEYEMDGQGGTSVSLFEWR